jgi:hypothetical protein
MRGAVDARSNNQIAHSNALQRIGVVGQAHPTEHRQKDGRVVTARLCIFLGLEVSGYSRTNLRGRPVILTLTFDRPKQTAQSM